MKRCPCRRWGVLTLGNSVGALAPDVGVAGPESAWMVGSFLDFRLRLGGEIERLI